MSDYQLGKMKTVKLRSIFENEEYDFSDWLSKTENLQLLNDELGIQLVLKQTEAPVGRFSVDLLAVEDGTDRIAVIENQLEPTDHDHLGKLITYGAGLHAFYLIWIVSEIKDEHLNAIEWINELAEGALNCFLIKLELWRIDDSKPSPKFTVYAKPNDFSTNIKKMSSGEISDTKAKQLEFWLGLKEHLQKAKSELTIQKPSPQHWINFSIGTSDAHGSLSINTVSSELVCELYIGDNKELYNWLLERKSTIESELGMSLDWRALPEKKASRIIAKRTGNINEKGKYAEYFAWFVETGAKFRKVFGTQIKDFN